MGLMYAGAGVKEEVSDKNVKAYAALTLVTASCHGVLNTTLIRPEPKYDEEGNDIFAWFDGVNTRLDAAKVVAKDWIDNVVTPIQSDIPSSVITFHNQFRSTTDYVKKLCEENPDMKEGDKEFKQVNQLLQALIDTIDNDIIVPIDNSSNRLKEWGSSMQKAHDDLAGEVSTVQNAEIELATDIERLNTSIDTLNDMISSECTLISVGAGLVGSGIFVALVGVVLCASGVGAVAGGIVIGTGAAMVIGGAVTWGVMQEKINKQYREIAEDRKEINTDQQLLASLGGIESGVTSAVTYMETAISALSEVRSMWDGFRKVIEGTITDMKNAEKGAGAVVKEMFTDAAQRQWEDAHEIAKKLLDTKIEVKDEGTMGDEAA